MSRKWNRIALVGASDLTEIVFLYAREMPLEIVCVIDPTADANDFPDWNVVSSFDTAHAYIISELKNPQLIYDQLTLEFSPNRILVPQLLEVAEKND